MLSSFSFVSKYYQYFLRGTATTISLSLVAIFFGFILGVALALMKIAKTDKMGLTFVITKTLNVVASAYIEIIRGTPLLVQTMIAYLYVQNLSMFQAGVLSMSINSAAYVAEIIRAGINSIDKGQSEAAKSLGLTTYLRFKEIILPQAMKNILPALGNEFIVLIKESAIVSVIGAHDLMYNAGIVRSRTYLGIEPLLVAAAIYFVLTFTLSRIMKFMEGRMNVER